MHRKGNAVWMRSRSRGTKAQPNTELVTGAGRGISEAATNKKPRLVS
jgi:hypothetical protein